MGRGALDGSVIIGTAGHVDHGKTALVKALTGVDTDRLPEEKRRGITVELGFAPIELDGGVHASVIDVPGHEAFVKTMVAGSAGIDVALLVIAADEGMMPQTREHLAILEMLEIPALVVALTKADLVDTEWLALVREEIAGQLVASRWPVTGIIPCSVVTGEGLTKLRSALSSAAPAAARGRAADIFRLPVDRCFTVKGTGTVVTGTVWSGELRREASVRVLPGDRLARVRQLHHHGEEVSIVLPGQRAAVALSGVDVADIPRGSALVTSEEWEATSMLDSAVTLFEDAYARIRSHTEVVFHLAGADVEASLIFPSDEAASDGRRFTRIKLSAPVAARGGDRFILRLPSPVGTIGGGVVLDPMPAHRSVTAAERVFPLSSAGDPRERFTAFLYSSGTAGISIASLPVRLGVTPELAAALVADSSCVISGGRCFVRRELDAAKERILGALKKAEKTFPLERGVQFESVSASAGSSRDLARLAVAELELSEKIIVDGSVVSRSGWKPSLTEHDEKIVESLLRAICSSEKEPPTAAELAEKFGGNVPVLLRYLEREGRVVQVGPDRFYARGAVDALIEKLRKDLSPGTEYGPSQLRDTLGFSRKYLIPFLEYCDRTGVTERKGDGRTLKSGHESLTQM